MASCFYSNEYLDILQDQQKRQNSIYLFVFTLKIHIVQQTTQQDKMHDQEECIYDLIPREPEQWAKPIRYVRTNVNSTNGIDQLTIHHQA